MTTEGAFSRTWNHQFFVQASVLACDRSGLERAQQFRLPGDFETHEAIVLVGDGLARDFPEILTTIVARSEDRQAVVALVSSAVNREHVAGILTGRGLSLESVRFLIAPTNTIWLRDFGPLFVCRPDGTTCAVDPGYGKPLRASDDGIPAAIAKQLEMPLATTDLVWHGGNLLSNGQGLLLTTTGAINANIELGYNTDTITRFLAAQFGARQVVVLEPLRGE
ncbi:MAG TPA: agmatine deiminase family protein, partial [Thermoguttaceae bacterium]|nr:agmatine deiminase family protein [Thermoguttaceae bacterium]